jgi:hypothetical protein
LWRYAEGLIDDAVAKGYVGGTGNHIHVALSDQLWPNRSLRTQVTE